MIDGYYYLHTNGKLIYKKYIDDKMVDDFIESDFVLNFWPMDFSDRMCAWRLIVEALASGAERGGVFDLASKWLCDDKDAKIYASKIGVNLFENEGVFVCRTRNNIANQGEGVTALHALADLCKKVGYKPNKTFKHSFENLVECS